MSSSDRSKQKNAGEKEEMNFLKMQLNDDDVMAIVVDFIFRSTRR